ncbi:MAG: hypothetical protein JWO81_2097 [Alphaproteobacteria bacterium]|nr:hypothetical protein [Alphaproteobacteria bacterium]
MSDPTAVNHDLSLLAPRFRAAVEASLVKCKAAGLDAMVFEGFRSSVRQAFLFAQGRTRPGKIVTRASTSLTSWHGYGLAVDVIHRTGFWEPFGKDARKNEQWFGDVAAIFKATGCNWGGDWTAPDTPHMQWGRCPASPTPSIRAMISARGVAAVWAAMQADAAAPPGPSPASAVVGGAVAAPSPPYASLVPGGFFSHDPFDLTVRRAIRTNNPGALNISPWQRAYAGFKDVTKPDSAGNVTTIYRTPEHGVGAWLHLFTVRYGFGPGGSPTLQELALKYSGETDPAAAAVRTYIAGWAAASGGTLNAASTIRLDQDHDVLPLARAMFHHEAGKPSPLSDAQILFGLDGERAGTLPKV